jgi:RNA polymerase sigma-70 factor, ECF subfamily
MGNRDRDSRFVELFRKHFRQLLGYVYIIVRDHNDAEDVVQQASLILWKKFDEYRPGTSFIAWACNIARFEALNFLKVKRRHKALFSESLQLYLAANLAEIPAAETDLRAAALEECIEKLPERQRDLLRRCFSKTETVTEIAKKIGRSAHSVYNSLRNIRTQLFDCIDRSVTKEFDQ